MDYLDAPQLRTWYEASLHYSGFENLDESVVDLWIQAVSHGLVSVPPGLLGSVAERLTHRPTGVRIAHGGRAPLEDRLLELMASGRSFAHLEGEFILEGADWSQERLLRVIERLVNRAGNLHDASVFFAANDIRHALSRDTGADRAFVADAILDRLYRDAIRIWIERDAALDDDDVFEVQHPHLFPTPSSRTLFRRMQACAREIRRELSGDLSLRQETDEVVSRYGEPQVLPLGGFDSFTNRGDVASLVSSELALIDDTEDIDLFDYKYLERELLYFKREEGLVFRIRRRVCVSIRLTPAMEHERNIAWLLALCLTLIERIGWVFSKDALAISVCLHGHLPTTLRTAIEFFRHFLRESQLDDRVAVMVGAVCDQPEPTHQNWFIGERELPDRKFIEFVFPELNEFAGLPRSEQSRTLAERIETIVERMVEIAHT